MNKSFILICGLIFSTNSIASQPLGIDLEVLADSVIVQDHIFTNSKLPVHFKLDKELGLLVHENITGHVIYREDNSWTTPEPSKHPKGITF